MFYIKNSCPVCRTGALGFRRCTDGHSLVLMCDECESVWASPELVSTANALEAVPPKFEVEELGVLVAGGCSGWANREEIVSKGWADFVAGEQVNT